MSDHERHTDEETAERADTVEDLDVPEGQQADVAGGVKQSVAQDDVGEGG
jgi:hypothetical protein